MADLILYIPNHKYSDDDMIFVSWLDANYYVSDKNDNTFKLATTSGGSTLVQFTETVIEGYVREIDIVGVTTITGLDHLEGETVTVTSAGSVAGVEVVSGGSITIADDVFTYQVGKPYTMKVRTMKLSIPQEGTTVQSRIKRIERTNIRYIRSQNGKAGQEYDGVEYLQPIFAEYSINSADTKPDNRLAQGGFSEDAYTTIISSDPFPFTVLATIIDVEVEK